MLRGFLGVWGRTLAFIELRSTLAYSCGQSSINFLEAPLLKPITIILIRNVSNLICKAFSCFWLLICLLPVQLSPFETRACLRNIQIKWETMRGKKNPQKNKTEQSFLVAVSGKWCLGNRIVSVFSHVNTILARSQSSPSLTRWAADLSGRVCHRFCPLLKWSVELALPKSEWGNYLNHLGMN